MYEYVESDLMSDTIEQIKRQISNNKVLLYLKGTPQLPKCGFSSTVVEILKKLQISYVYVNVLTNPDIRFELPSYANWPTFPQLYLVGELIGGCDIIQELYEKSELEILFKRANVLTSTEAIVSA